MAMLPGRRTPLWPLQWRQRRWLPFGPWPCLGWTWRQRADCARFALAKSFCRPTASRLGHVKSLGLAADGQDAVRWLIPLRCSSSLVPLIRQLCPESAGGTGVALKPRRRVRAVVTPISPNGSSALLRCCGREATYPVRHLCSGVPVVCCMPGFRR